MNLLKKFIRPEPDYDGDIYGEDEGIGFDFPPDIEEEFNKKNIAESVAAIDNPARKNPEIHTASPEKVALKLMQPRSHTEATKIADMLKEGCIVLLDISNLTKEKAHRLVDFLAGVAYVLGGEMIKTNKNTIVVSPAGVDISGFVPEPAAPAPQPEVQYEEVYEEAPANEA